MNRKDFLKIASITLSVPMISALDKLEHISNSFETTKPMPVLFLGHGSPMIGIEDNEFVKGFKKQASTLDKPNAIVVISAHWETKGTFVTAMENPRTIHDFGGFPEALYQVQYPAPGHPALAKEISELIKPANTVQLDETWGLDHGSWTVVKHLYPNADVPVLQLSIDYTMTAYKHYQLAQQLKKLRNKGVLLVGSGNIVHNLRKIAFDKVNMNFGFDWALEVDYKVKKWILEGNHENLIHYNKQGAAFHLAIPTAEHYLPLLYALGLKDKKDDILFFNDSPVAGSISMTSLKFG